MVRDPGTSRIASTDAHGDGGGLGHGIHLIGADSGLREVMERVRLVADADATVLLRGESGTGKELVAATLHRISHRRHGPFVIVNCAAVPRELMESEMFGHVRGAFTGATSEHCGYFEAAGHGTLLLDEIGDLHLDLQAKILRVLENGTFRRVGSSSVLRNRARILCSTNQPLETLLSHGRFRADLYYRVNVFPIEVPPLRERKQDIVPMAEHFLERFARRHRQPPRITAACAELLRSHPWYGNVRELRNCMERAALVCIGSTITPRELRPLLDDRVMPPASGPEPIAEVERRAVLEALKRCGGNRTRAAEALGIGRRTLQKKLKLWQSDGSVAVASTRIRTRE